MDRSGLPGASEGFLDRDSFYRAARLLLDDNFSGDFVFGLSLVAASDETILECEVFLKSFLRPGSLIGRLHSDVVGFIVRADGFDPDELLAQIDSRLPASPDFRIETGIYRIEDPTLAPECMAAYAGLGFWLPRKRDGHSLFVFNRAFLENPETQRSLEASIRQADSESRVIVRMQPVFECSAAPKIVAAEALIRLKSKDFGELPPFVFLPLLEEMHFTYIADIFVLEQACLFQRSRLDRGLGTVSISVNISRDDLLHHPGFMSRLIDVVDSSGIDRSLIWLELSEGVLVETRHPLSRLISIKAQIEALSKAGFKILIDDYGTGNSNIATISRVPFDILKIDKFFADRCLDPFVSRVAEHLVQCMHEVGIPTIIEGVEDSGQCAFFQRIGCDYAQGFRFAAPMARSEFDALLDASL